METGDLCIKAYDDTRAEIAEMLKLGDDYWEIWTYITKDFKYFHWDGNVPYICENSSINPDEGVEEGDGSCWHYEQKQGDDLIELRDIGQTIYKGSPMHYKPNQSTMHVRDWVV